MLSRDPELKNRTKLNLVDIRTLRDLSLSKCYFLWEKEIYLLKKSAPIGLVIMVVIAETFLQHHESNTINIINQQPIPSAPNSYARYVDDNHARFKSMETAAQFHQILNKQDPHISYTMEIKDTSKSIQSLDLDITNKGDVR